jgi:hypothetical protein
MIALGRVAAAAAAALAIAGLAVADERAVTREITGTVKKSDRASGAVLIDLAGGDDLTLHLTPREAAKFRTGDQVTVSMDVRQSRSGAEPLGEPALPER